MTSIFERLMHVHTTGLAQKANSAAGSLSIESLLYCKPVGVSARIGYVGAHRNVQCARVRAWEPASRCLRFFTERKYQHSIDRAGLHTLFKRRILVRLCMRAWSVAYIALYI